MRSPQTLPLTESNITLQIKHMLEKLGAQVIQTHGQIWAKIPPFAGLSDLIVNIDGKFVAIEVKRPSCKLTALQEQFLHDVRAAGGIAFVAYSVEDVVRELGLKVKLYPLFGGAHA